MEEITLRRFQPGDEFAVSDLICTTLKISNGKDYPPAFIEESIRDHSPALIAERAREGHFYLAVYGEKIIGCGGITGYWAARRRAT